MGITPSRTLLIAVRPRVSSSALWPGAVRDGWSGASTPRWPGWAPSGMPGGGLFGLWTAHAVHLMHLAKGKRARCPPSRPRVFGTWPDWSGANRSVGVPSRAGPCSRRALAHCCSALPTRSLFLVCLGRVVGPSESSGPGPPCPPVSCSAFFSQRFYCSVRGLRCLWWSGLWHFPYRFHSTCPPPSISGPMTALQFCSRNENAMVAEVQLVLSGSCGPSGGKQCRCCVPCHLARSVGCAGMLSSGRTASWCTLRCRSWVMVSFYWQMWRQFSRLWR